MHRDLKLENIMMHFTNYDSNKITLGKYIKKFNFNTMQEQMICKITDLGFAKKL